jgi:hypothetical protein
MDGAVISQEIDHFITTAVRTSNPTIYAWIYASGFKLSTCGFAATLFFHFTFP